MAPGVTGFDRNARLRRSIRQRGYDYTQSGLYFVTICTVDRHCLHGEAVGSEMRLSEGGRLVGQTCESIPARFPNVGLDAYPVMPNRLHGIVMLETRPDGQGQSQDRPRLSAVIRAFESISGIEGNRALGTSGPCWQRNDYERIVRNDSELERVRRYITNNPANWATDDENPMSVSPLPRTTW